MPVRRTVAAVAIAGFCVACGSESADSEPATDPSTVATQAPTDDLAAKLMTAEDVPAGYAVQPVDPEILAASSGIGAIAAGQVEVTSDSSACEAGIAMAQKAGLPDTKDIVGASAENGPESYTELIAPAEVLEGDVEGLRMIAQSCDGATVHSSVQKIETDVTFGTFDPGQDLVGVTMTIDTEASGRSYTRIAVGQVGGLVVSLTKDSSAAVDADEFAETLEKVLTRLGG